MKLNCSKTDKIFFRFLEKVLHKDIFNINTYFHTFSAHSFNFPWKFLKVELKKEPWSTTVNRSSWYWPYLWSVEKTSCLVVRKFRKSHFRNHIIKSCWMLGIYLKGRKDGKFETNQTEMHQWYFSQAQQWFGQFYVIHSKYFDIHR